MVFDKVYFNRNFRFIKINPATEEFDIEDIKFPKPKHITFSGLFYNSGCKSKNGAEINTGFLENIITSVTYRKKLTHR